MESNLKVVISKDDSQLKELLKSLADLQSLMGGSIPAAFKKASAAGRQSQKEILDEVVKSNAKIAEVTKNQISATEKANALIAASKEKYSKIEEKYAKDSGEHIIADIKKMQDERAQILASMSAAVDKETKVELKARAAEIADEMKLYKQAALEKEKVAKGGEGGKAGILGTGRHEAGEHKGGAGVGVIAEVVGVAAAVEGLEKLVEKSKEVADAQHQLQAGTGLSGEALEKAGKQAEEMGEKLGVPGDAAKTTMGKIAGLTHAEGADLQRMTEAAIAYEQVTGRSAAKMMRTAKGREEIMVSAEANIAKAQQAAQDPARQAQLAQAQLEETAGELASTLLTGLQPAIKALTPILRELGELASSVLKPVFAALAPILERIGNVLKTIVGFLAENKDAVLVFAGAIGTVVLAVKGWAIAQEALNLVLEANPIGLIITALAALAAGMVYLYENVQPVHDIMQKIWDVIKATGEAIWAFIQNYVSSLVKAFEGVGKVINSLIHLDFKGMIEGAKQVGSSVVNAYVGSAQKAGAAFGDSLGKSMADHASDAAKDNVKKTLETIDKGLAKAGLTPASKAALEKSREEWVAYGKKIGADVGEAVSGGMAVGHMPEAENSEKKSKGKSGPSPEEIAKKKADDLLKIQKDEIALSDSEDEQAKKDELQREIEHATALLAIAQKYHKDNSVDVMDARAALHALEKQQRGTYEDTDIEEAKANRAKEEAETAKAHDLEIANQKNFLSTQLEILRKNNIDTTSVERQQADLEIQIQQEKYAKDIKDLDKESALYQQLTIQNANTIQGINDKFNNERVAKERAAAKDRQASQLKEAQFFAGPVLSAFNNGFGQMFKGINAVTEGWAKSNNMLTAFFGNILDGFVKMVESMVAKIAENAIIMAFMTAITGGTGGLGLLSGIGSMLGLAEGGVVTRPTMIGSGVMTRPMYLASGGTMPIIGGEAGHEAVIPLNAYPGMKAMMQGDMGFSEHADRIIAAINSSGNHVAIAAQRQKIGIPFNNATENARNNYLKSEDRRSF